MKPPIYIYERRDLSVLTTVDGAERSIEATDVRNGIYQFFDAEGTELEATVYLDNRGIELCRISVAETPKARPRTLHEILVDLLAVDEAQRNVLGTRPLEELVRMSLQFAQPF